MPYPALKNKSWNSVYDISQIGSNAGRKENWGNPTFLRDKPHKNNFELVGTVLKKSGFRLSQDAQGLCAVAKGGTILTT